MKKAKILIVEDEGIVALDLQNRLTQMGYIVPPTARRGEDAVQKVGELLPDLVLMDIHLYGEMDGIEAARQIHSRWGIPVIYLSALSDPDTRLRVEATRPVGVLSKPFDNDELRRVIQSALES